MSVSVSVSLYISFRLSLFLSQCLSLSLYITDHVTDLLRYNLHWLRVPQRITYKLSLITYKAIHNSMPDYITDFCIGVYKYFSGFSGFSGAR